MKNVLITGAGSGIGYETAILLSGKGYRVFAAARSDESIRNLTAKGLTAIKMDMACQASIESAMEEIKGRTEGKLFAVFHNAGYGQSGAIEDLPVAAIEKQFQVNLFSAHQINKIVIPWMRAAGTGRIIWNSSVLGFITLPYRGAYSASKFAMEAMADALRLELKETGICVSVIQPGPISTNFRRNSYQAFLKAVDLESTFHLKRYDTLVKRLTKEGPGSNFTLPPDSCSSCVLHAVSSNRPKHRYRITRMTKISLVLKHLLPSFLLDKIVYSSI